MDEKPIIQGVLWKRAQKSGANWKRRFFRLYSNKMTYSLKESGKIRGEMKFTEEFFVQDFTIKGKFGFLVTDFTTSHYLAAETIEVKDFWVHAMVSVIRKQLQQAKYFEDSLEKDPEQMEKEYQARLDQYYKTVDRPLAKQSRKSIVDVQAAQMLAQALDAQDRLDGNKEDALKQKFKDEADRLRVEAESMRSLAEKAVDSLNLGGEIDMTEGDEEDEQDDEDLPQKLNRPSNLANVVLPAIDFNEEKANQLESGSLPDQVEAENFEAKQAPAEPAVAQPEEPHNTSSLPPALDVLLVVEKRKSIISTITSSFRKPSVAAPVPVVETRKQSIVPVAEAGKASLQPPVQPPRKPAILPVEPAVRKPSILPVEPAARKPSILPMEPAGRKPSILPMEPAGRKPSILPVEPVARKPSILPVEPVARKPSILPVEPAARKPSILPLEPAARKPSILPVEPVAQKPSISPVEPAAAQKPSILPVESTRKASVLPPAAAPTTPAKETPKVAMGIANRLAGWQNKVDAHQDKQTSNVFSGNYNGKKEIAKESYGKPPEGSKTEERAIAAIAWVEQEIEKLISVIKQIGAYDDETKGITVTFGPLFDAYVDISDTLVGILLRAKKRRRLVYQGDMLLQGYHSHVKITLV